VRIRLERPSDLDAIRAVNRAAFGAEVEANLVDALRREASPIISLVADEDGAVIGHVMFSPVSIDGEGADVPALMGLAPLAVLPGGQRRGVGAALVREGLAACRRRGVAAVVLVGMPEYYPRFGFVPASRFGLRCEYEVPDDVFMAIELETGALAGRHGLARYHPAFVRAGA
jgi:putative acetyltransferase